MDYRKKFRFSLDDGVCNEMLCVRMLAVCRQLCLVRGERGKRDSLCVVQLVFRGEQWTVSYGVSAAGFERASVWCDIGRNGMRFELLKFQFAKNEASSMLYFADESEAWVEQFLEFAQREIVK